MSQSAGTPAEVRLSEVLSALSYALDLTEGQPPGHTLRSCLIGMRLADVLGVPQADRSALFYALLLKDAGCSTNAARLCALFGADDHLLKREFKLVDWSDFWSNARYAFRYALPDRRGLRRVAGLAAMAVKGSGSGRESVATRCERGADIATMLGFARPTADAIRHLDEHWDGRGMPLGLEGEAISLFGRILGLSQTVEIFANTFDTEAAYAVARDRRGNWFDPALVDALESFRRDGDFWGSLRGPDVAALVARHEPPDRVILADDARLDRVAEAFARVIDAKSPYTFQHSTGVAAIAVTVADRLGFDAVARRDLRRAALLHDIGKLGVSNRVLDKPDKLDEGEWAAMRRHTGFTLEILQRVGPFRGLAEVAASHHERLDGGGYHRGLAAEALSRPARVLAVADICEALLADRPYRAGLSVETVMDIMGRQVDTAICAECFDALASALRHVGRAVAVPVLEGSPP